MKLYTIQLTVQIAAATEDHAYQLLRQIFARTKTADVLVKDADVTAMQPYEDNGNGEPPAS